MEQIVVCHFSDAHFGDDLLNRRFGWLGGFHAHDWLLCAGMSQALEDVRNVVRLPQNETPFFLLTGDLTATGLPGEFSCGHLFFRGSRPADFDFALSDIGLRLLHYDIGMIPGNHDHWDGSRLPAGPYNADIFGRSFRTTPWKLQLVSKPTGRLVLELAALDSNSGMKQQASLGDRLRARGRISGTEFATLDKLMSNSHGIPAGARIVRAIAIHHPFSITSTIPLLDAQPLDANSRIRC